MDSAFTPLVSSKQLACAQCRAAKVKCRPSHVGEPCMRCHVRSMMCQVPARKKRKTSRTDIPRALSNGYESSSSSQVAAHSLTIAYPDTRISETLDQWRSTLSLGASSNHHLIAHTADTDAFCPIPQDPAASHAPTLPLPISSFDGTYSARAGASHNLIPPSSDNTAATAHTARSEEFHEPSNVWISANLGRSTSDLSQASLPRNPSRPVATMSLRQELQEVKDDFGLPTTRDVSRDGSLEPGAEYSTGQNWSSDFARITREVATAPNVPGVLSADEVSFLFDKYFDYHNTCVGLLDPALHTPTFTLASSPLLFCTILAVTAEVFRPGQYSILWQRTETMISQSFAAAEESIELCQAVSLVCYWNDVEDRSGLLRLGFAVRIAHHLGLDRAPRRPLPENELAARLQLNRERTWISLSGFDLVLNGLFGGISTMTQSRSLSDIESWIADHPDYPCHSDNVLLVIASVAATVSDAKLLNEMQPDSQHRADGLEKLRAARVEWSMRWLGSRPPGGRPSRSFQAFLRFTEVACARDITNMTRLTAQTEHRSYLWNDIYAAIDSLRELSKDLSETGLLFWATNSIILHASKCALLLTKYIAMLTPITAQCIMDIFQDIHLASSLSIAARTRKGYLAKLFGSLLRISARRLATGKIAAAREANNHFIPGPLMPDPLWAGDPRETDDTIIDLRDTSGHETQSVLETSIDAFVAQFSSNAGMAFEPGDSVAGDTTWLAEYFSHQ